MDINIHMCGYDTDIWISIYICVVITQIYGYQYTYVWLKHRYMDINIHMCGLYMDINIHMCGYNTDIWI